MAYCQYCSKIMMTWETLDIRSWVLKSKIPSGWFITGIHDSEFRWPKMDVRRETLGHSGTDNQYWLIWYCISSGRSHVSIKQRWWCQVCKRQPLSTKHGRPWGSHNTPKLHKLNQRLSIISNRWILRIQRWAIAISMKFSFLPPLPHHLCNIVPCIM